MKRTLLFALSLLAVVACSKFDDSAIWEELNKHEDRIVKLETLCNQMNTNITSLQTIIIALQSNDYVVNIAPIMEGNKEIGYTITFSKSGSITIFHGKDGENGKDGANGADGKDGQDGKDGVDGKDGQDGKDGKDGYTPELGVKQHTDGKYYWTLDGNWILDSNGNMIPTTGEDGENGANGTNGKDGQDGEDGKDGANGVDGKDGVTPQLKIENNYWYISYDNAATWVQLGKATGEDGSDGVDGEAGKDGDSIFKSVVQDNEYVYFNLSDGTMITLPKHDKENIQFEDLRVKAICCKNWDTNNDGELSYAEAAAVTDIGDVFSRDADILAFTEFKYFTGVTSLSAKAFTACKNLWKINIPENVVNFGDGNTDGITFGSSPSGKDNYYGTFLGAGIVSITLPERFETIGVGAFHYSALRNINFNKNLKNIKNAAFKQCNDLCSINLPNGLTKIGSRAFSYCDNLTSVTIPESVTSVGEEAFCNNDKMSIIYCKPSDPPTCKTTNSSYGPLGYSSVSGKIIYVPTESVNAYKAAEGWKQHQNLIYGYDFN